VLVYGHSNGPPYEDALHASRARPQGGRADRLDRATLDTYYTPQRIKDLRTLLADWVGALGVRFHPPGMASPDPAAREQAVEHFKRLVEVGVALGTHLVNNVGPQSLQLALPRIMDKHIAQE